MRRILFLFCFMLLMRMCCGLAGDEACFEHSGPIFLLENFCLDKFCLFAFSFGVKKRLFFFLLDPMKSYY